MKQQDVCPRVWKFLNPWILVIWIAMISPMQYSVAFLENPYVEEVEASVEASSLEYRFLAVVLLRL